LPKTQTIVKKPQSVTLEKKVKKPNDLSIMEVNFLQNIKKKTLFAFVTLLTLCVLVIPLVSAQQSPVIGNNSDSRVQITIYSFSTNQTIPYYPYTPSHSGYVWAWIDISVKNVGPDAVSTNSLYSSLKDSQDYVYVGSVVPDDPQWMKLQDLSSGSSQRGNFYFEIPANANILSFNWDDYSSNLNIPKTAIPEFPLVAILLIFGLTVSLSVLAIKRYKLFK
jgi:hypothetical protein